MCKMEHWKLETAKIAGQSGMAGITVEPLMHTEKYNYLTNWAIGVLTKIKTQVIMTLSGMENSL